MSKMISIWNSADSLIKKYIRVFEERRPSIFLFIYITKENGTFVSFHYIFSSNKLLIFEKFINSFE